MHGGFHPLITEWFQTQLGEPTEPQRRGWPEIAAGRHTLISAPTGSGKTLAAFLGCIDQLLRQWIDGRLEQQVSVVYVSPLRALSNDIHRNLETPLSQICALAEQRGMLPPPIETAVRTGDTTATERQRLIRRPPHILVTTPESLYLLLTSAKGRARLRNVRTVIVDEIHALARDKRGSHLALSLERLEALCESPPARIGLSATVRPIEEMACFLVGAHNIDAAGKPACSIVDVGHVRELDLAIEVPPSELSAVCSNEQWDECYARLVDLIQSHRSTLVFVNTRRLAERIAHHLTELLGENAVASHHGSLSRNIRLNAEQRLKAGELKAIVATASLEMGIDIGFIDLVCQIGSPRSIAAFLQRVGRSGHSLGVVPKGRLFPLTRDELVECLALVRAVKQQKLDAVEIPVAPLDILAQQIVAAVASEECEEPALFEMFRQAWPYRDLTRAQFDEIIRMLAEGLAPSTRRGAYLHRDAINGRLRPRRGARLAALMSGGAIPETAEYRVVTEDESTIVGKVDEDFAIESHAGDIFLLGNTSWRVRYVRDGKVVVQDAEGLPPSIPFWFGEAPGRTIELSTEISQLRADIVEQLATGSSTPSRLDDHEASISPLQGVIDWLVDQCGASTWAAGQALDYIRVQHAALGLVPTQKSIVFERFFDESGGMQLVIHAPLGARINRAWGLAMRKRFCRSFDFELQAAATDDAILLSIGPQHSFPINDLFSMLGPHNAEELLTQALLAAPLFQTRWRWNVTRALAVLRMQNGKKVPPHLQRFRSDDLLSAVFPQSTGCLENHHGDVEIPDHPLVRQTVHDGLHEAMDLNRWLEVLERVRTGEVELVARDTREPSPFCHEILNANPYAFLDDAPLEERRTRAIATRRGLSTEEFQELGRLDELAIRQVCDEAWPMVRDEDEVHDALKSLVALRDDELGNWSDWLEKLVLAGRATQVKVPQATELWIATENWPLVRAIYPSATCHPPAELPPELEQNWERTDALVQLLRGRSQHSGPFTAVEMASRFQLDEALVDASLMALEGQGVVIRGHFSAQGEPNDTARPTQWCDRRLLARIHRLTLAGLRKQIKPVEPADFMRFLVRFHHLDDVQPVGGPAGLRKSIEMLQGFQAPAGAWEPLLLASRVRGYDPQWLDQSFMTGEIMWGRLQPPRDGSSSAAKLNRAAAISLVAREDLNWLLPGDRSRQQSPSPSAARVLDSLQEQGALFFTQLEAASELDPVAIEQALRELARLGLVTSDCYAAVRAIIGKSRKAWMRRRARHAAEPARPASGRWSLFPGQCEVAAPEERLERWCHQLLRRYGVLFRDLLARETAAPRWHELVPVLRRLELRGEIRGGRFVASVAGEQFATAEAITLLRAIRDEPLHADQAWTVVSAADPLNLAGIVMPGKRIPASHVHAFVLQCGECVATKIGRSVEFFKDADATGRFEMTRALHRGRRLPDQLHTIDNNSATAHPVRTGVRGLFD